MCLLLFISNRIIVSMQPQILTLILLLFVFFFSLREISEVGFMTLLPLREPTSGRHHCDLRAHSGQWAAPFKMLSQADGREYSKSSGRAGIIRPARLMCLVWTRSAGYSRRVWWLLLPSGHLYILPIFFGGGGQQPAAVFLFYFLGCFLMFICSVGLEEGAGGG